MGAYKGKASTIKEAEDKSEGFKKGGKIAKKDGGCMSTAAKGRAPRKSGGGVFSSAKGGTPRGKASHY